MYHVHSRRYIFNENNSWIQLEISAKRCWDAIAFISIHEEEGIGWLLNHHHQISIAIGTPIESECSAGGNSVFRFSLIYFLVTIPNYTCLFNENAHRKLKIKFLEECVAFHYFNMFSVKNSTTNQAKVNIKLVIEICFASAMKNLQNKSERRYWAKFTVIWKQCDSYYCMRNSNEKPNIRKRVEIHLKISE